MNYQERNEQSKSYRQFRTSLDFGMGILYIIIGLSILYVKYFGAMSLPTSFAYILGALMIAYGLFRIYRGAQAMKVNKRDISRDFPDLNGRRP